MSVVLGMAAFIVALVAGGFGYDWRQRRRHATAHDVSAAAARTQGISQGQGLPPSAGSQGWFGPS